MTDAEERNNWERFKNSRIGRFPRPSMFNLSCYEVFDSFDEFVLNGRPYHLNGCSMLPPQQEQSVPNTDLPEYPCQQEQEEEIQENNESVINPMTETLIQSEARGSVFKGWVGAAGAQQMKTMLDANIPCRWTNP